MASQYLARLGVILGIDTAKWEADVNQAIAAQQKLKKEITRNSRDAEKEIERLTWAVKDYGRQVSMSEKIEREFLAGGKFAQAAGERKERLRELARQYDAVAAAARQSAKDQLKAAGGLTKQQIAALGYQTTDILTGLAGGQNPLLVLIQQGGQLRDQFGGFVPLFNAIKSVFTATRLVVGGLATAFAAVGFAAYKGTTELENFNKNLALTNNYAGISIDRFRQLSDNLASKFNVSVSTARDVFTALIQSGKLTEPAMASVANVIAKLSKLTGESAEIIAKDLIPSFDGSAASAARLNDKYNFLTIQQYRQIELLAAQGKNQEAAKLTADLLSQSLEKQKIEINLLTQSFIDLKNAISNAFKSFSDMFMPETNIQRMQRFAKEAEELSKKFGPNATPEQKAKIGGKILEYLGTYRIVAQEQEKLDQQSIKAQEEKEKIQNEIAAGGLQKRRQLDYEYAKLKNDIAFQAAVYGATEIERIYLEGNKKAADAVAEYEKANIEERNVNKLQRAKILAKQIEAINLESEQKIADISRKRAEEIRVEQQTRIDALELERQKLQLYEENILISEKDLKIAMNRLKVEQEIAKLNADKKLTDKDRQEAIGRATDIQRRSDELATMEERLKHLRDVNAAVWQNMESAIDQFIRTGKFSFKDFARSIILDLIAIYTKAQALQLFNMMKGSFGSFFSGSSGMYTDSSGMFQAGMALADGGEPPVGKVSLVGERGPELFVPRTAGTIIPNNKLNSLGGDTYITNNNIQAIDVKSFEDRILQSSNTVWAANQYANKSLAQPGGRA